MANILKAEFFKLRKNKAIWISLGIIVGVTMLYAALMLLFGGFLDMLVEGMSAELNAELSRATGGIIPMFNATGALMMFGSMTFMVSAVLVSLIAGRFYAGENGSGVLRNSLMAGQSRTMVYTAKFIMTMIVASAAYFVPIIIGMAVLGIAGGFGGANAGVFLGYMALQWLLFMSVGGLIFLLSVATRSVGGSLGITFGVCYFFVVLSMMASIGWEFSAQMNAGYDWSSGTYPGEPHAFFRVLKEICMMLSPTQLSFVAPMDLEPERVAQAALVGVGTLAVTYGGGLAIFNRRDHK